jgi:hypothetical protein
MDLCIRESSLLNRRACGGMLPIDDYVFVLEDGSKRALHHGLCREKIDRGIRLRSKTFHWQ